MHQIFAPGSTYSYQSDKDQHVQITYIVEGNNTWGHAPHIKHEILVRDLCDNQESMTLFSFQKNHDNSRSVEAQIMGDAEKRVLSSDTYTEILQKTMEIFSIEVDQLILPRALELKSASQKEQFKQLQSAIALMKAAI